MNGPTIFFPKKQRNILQNPNSSESKSFFEGMRMAINMIKDATPKERTVILSTTNQTHLIACMSRFAKRQGQSQYNDSLEILNLYDSNKVKLEAFLFNVAKIDPITGQALDDDNQPIEDENFQLLEGKTPKYWPRYEITTPKGQALTSEEYYNLPSEERAEYHYVRYFSLEKNGVETFRVHSNDYAMVSALIHQLLEIDGDAKWLRKRLRQTFIDSGSPLCDFLIKELNNIVTPKQTQEEQKPATTAALEEAARLLANINRDSYTAKSGKRLLSQLTTISTMDMDAEWCYPFSCHNADD